jgi:hypothetical protein
MGHVNLRIEFDFYGTKPDGYTDYFNKKSIQQILTLNTLAPFTYFPAAGRQGFKPPGNTIFGCWSSYSNYLGKETSSKYYITRINFPEPGKWVELVNPVGLFFDSTSEDEPFLILYDFQPTDTSPRAERAKGKLQNRAPNPIDTWVDWYPYFG